MEFRSWSASGMSPGTDTPALWFITTAVVVGLVMSGVVLASGWGLAAGEAAAPQTAAGPACVGPPRRRASGCSARRPRPAAPFPTRA